MGHRVYAAIVDAVRTGRLQEPFSPGQFREACPGLGEGTYRAFLAKHRVGNLGDQSELFEWTAPASFRLVRPIRYGL